jgi:AGZA family xanthine/uracil permease-like MFS transporter
MGVPWQTALGLVFISGVLFFLLTLAGVRQLIVAAVPRALFSAIAAGHRPLHRLHRPEERGPGGGQPRHPRRPGRIKSPTVQLALLGLAILAALMVLKVRGAMFIGIVATAILGWVLGLASGSPRPTASAK